MYKGYGSIRKKPEIHGIPLKRAPLATDKGLDAVMDECPKEDVKVLVDGATVPWWKSPKVHWYIIGGQHTITACRELAEQYPDGSDQKKDLLEFEVIPVFSRDADTLVRVSNALNLNIAEKVARETFRSCAEMGRAAWVKAGCPEPHRGGGKPSPDFEVCIFHSDSIIRNRMILLMRHYPATVSAASRYLLHFVRMTSVVSSLSLSAASRYLISPL